MNTISWLLVGHLVGDFVLQNDWMAKGKKTRFFSVPGLVHYSAYTLAVLAFLIMDPSSSVSWLNLVLVGLFILVTHSIIDGTSLVQAWMRFYHQTDVPLVRIMVDQTLHLLVLVTVTIWLLKG
jgi:hypothetical protein